MDGDNANAACLNTTTFTNDLDYNDLSNKPSLFDDDYNTLTNTHLLFDGDYNSLTDKPDY
jgi:hypothetical protein